MVRLLLILGPASSICGGIGVSIIFRNFSKSIRYSLLGFDLEKRNKSIKSLKKSRIPPDVALIGLVILGKKLKK